MTVFSCSFWWRQLAVGLRLIFTSSRSGWGEGSCPRSTWAIHSVAVGRTPNLPIKRRTLTTKLPPRTPLKHFERQPQQLHVNTSEVSVYFGGGCAPKFYCILRDRLRSLRCRFGLSKRLKNTERKSKVRYLIARTARTLDRTRVVVKVWVGLKGEIISRSKIMRDLLKKNGAFWEVQMLRMYAQEPLLWQIYLQQCRPNQNYKTLWPNFTFLYKFHIFSQTAVAFYIPDALYFSYQGEFSSYQAFTNARERLAGQGEAEGGWWSRRPGPELPKDTWGVRTSRWTRIYGSSLSSQMCPGQVRWRQRREPDNDLAFPECSARTKQ